MKIEKTRNPLAIAFALLLFALSSTRGHAQNASAPAAAPSDDALTEIVVTGTLIRGAQVVGSSVVSVGRQDILDSGQTDTADVLRSLPFVSLSGSSEIASQSSSNFANLNNTRLNGINIRGLGVDATLILLDGRRVAPGGVGGQVFDPSSIPTIALERIEVVPDGASATYGSDAVAGVANLILRKQFQGLEVQGSDGWAPGFSRQLKFSAIAGHEWDGGSIMVAGEYFSHPHLQTSEYPNLYDPNQTAYGGRNQNTLGGVPGNISTAAGAFGLPAGNGAGVTPAEFGPPHTTDQYTGADILPSEERHSVVISAEQKINDTTRVWAEGHYSDRFGILDQGPTIQASLQVPSTNPFFIAGASKACAPPLAAGQCNFVTYSFANDIPAPTSYYQSQSDQVALGFSFDLPHKLQLDIYGTDSTDDEKSLGAGLLNLNAVNAALALTNPATALNVVGSGGNNNPATTSALYGTNLNGSRFQRNVLNAKLDGPVYDLPGGSIKMAVGAEVYYDTLWDISNYSDTGTPNTSEFATAYTTEKHRTVGSQYAEFLVPFFSSANALPGLQQLQLDLAVRHDHYSDFGSTTNPKFGLNWDPVTDLSFHGSFGKSFRAPTLCDINPTCTGTVSTRQTADPGYALNTNPTPGLPPGQSIVSFVLGGNANLQPETARTYSFGGDFHPEYIKGLAISVNYFNIDYKNIIDTPAAFNASISTNPYYANLFVRNPTPAQVLAFWKLVSAANPSGGFQPSQVNLLADGNRQNVGEAKMQGFDISGIYKLDTPIGGWTAGITSEYIFQYLYSLVPGAPFVERVNEINGTSTAFPLRFTARGQLGWNNWGFRVNGFLNYHNGYTNIGPPITPVVEQHIGSYATVDLTAAYDTGAQAWGYLKNLTVGVDVLNLFNREPPFALIGTTEYDPANTSPLGRLVTVNFRKKF